jgi:hypothetical protein
VVLAAAVDTNTPVAIGTTVAVFVLGILAVTGWALAGTLRHAQLRNGLLDHRGVAAILGAVVGGLGMGIGGPILGRRLRRIMLANRDGWPQ